MSDSPTIAAARRFLALVEDGRPPSTEQLARALDELAMAYHHTPEGDPAHKDHKPQSREFSELFGRYSGRFPNLGFYPVTDPSGLLSAEPMVGDAIDDLADITQDLEKVIWRFENVGADDAHWYFRLGYQIHWGRHLRELALYLHARTW